jgi:ribosomal protein S18 acetylase RimI-like enzyme
MDDGDKHMALSIRRATTSDIEELVGLVSYIDQIHQPYDRRQIRQGSPQRANGQHLAKGIADPTTVVLIGETNGSIVGYARMEIKNTNGNRLFNPMRLGIVHEIVVAQSHGRNGVGTAFMEALHTEARAAGVERIQLEHYAANAAAGRLYAKLGYATMRLVCVKDL